MPRGGDTAGTRRRLRPGRRCRGPGARRRTAWCVAGAVAKLAGRRPARPHARIGSVPSPQGAPIPACCGQGLRGPLGHTLVGAEWARPQGGGAQAALPPAPRPGHSAASGWDGPPGPVEPTQGRRRHEGEMSLPLCPLLSAFLRPALFGGRLLHPPGMGGERESQSWIGGRGPQGPRWGAVATLGVSFGNSGPGVVGMTGGLIRGQGAPMGREASLVESIVPAGGPVKLDSGLVPDKSHRRHRSPGGTLHLHPLEPGTGWRGCRQGGRSSPACQLAGSRAQRPRLRG